MCTRRSGCRRAAKRHFHFHSVPTLMGKITVPPAFYVHVFLLLMMNIKKELILGSSQKSEWSANQTVCIPPLQGTPQFCTGKCSAQETLRKQTDWWTVWLTDRCVNSSRCCDRKGGTKPRSWWSAGSGKKRLCSVGNPDRILPQVGEMNINKSLILAVLLPSFIWSSSSNWVWLFDFVCVCGLFFSDSVTGAALKTKTWTLLGWVYCLSPSWPFPTPLLWLTLLEISFLFPSCSWKLGSGANKPPLKTWTDVVRFTDKGLSIFKPRLVCLTLLLQHLFCPRVYHSRGEQLIIVHLSWLSDRSAVICTSQHARNVVVCRLRCLLRFKFKRALGQAVKDSLNIWIYMYGYLYILCITGLMLIIRRTIFVIDLFHCSFFPANVTKIKSIL